MRQIFSALAVALAVSLAAGCAVSTLEPVTFPLDYRFMRSEADIFPAPECARYLSLEITEGRPDAPGVGERTIQDKEGSWQIAASGDPEAWVRQSAETIFGHAGIFADPGAASRIHLELRSLRIDESAHRNAVFNGRVLLGVQVIQGAGETVAWEGRADGTARNWGRPGNPANYQETVNHALDRAMVALANDDRLHRALCE